MSTSSEVLQVNETKTMNRTKSKGKRKGHRRRSFDPLLFLNAAGVGRRPEAHRKHEIVFSEGELSKHVYYIRDGGIKLSVNSKEGKVAVVGILGPTDFFGEDGIAGTKVCMSTATATTDCDLLRIDNQRMAQVLHGDRDFSDFFMTYLLTRKARVEADLVDQLFNSSEKRLARTLLMLARYGREGATESTIPKVNQETLASMVGTTRSRISFFMNKFRKMGFIKYNGGMQVHGSLVNVLLHDQCD